MVEDQAELEQQRRRQQLQQGGGGGSPPHPGYSCSVLLCGTRGGCLQLHDADSGAVLMRQQLHTGPVLSIAVRTWRMGEANGRSACHEANPLLQTGGGAMGGAQGP